MNRYILIGLIFLSPTFTLAEEPKAPATVKELFADFDPRKNSLDAKIVREWEKDGIVFRFITFHIDTFKGKPARMAAFYAFSKGVKKAAALLHLHGGGQRAFLHEVEFYAKRGYPCLSINWGGREMEEAKEGDPNTDWGAVDPTQKNVPGYFNLQPGEKCLDPFDSPRNNNWYLLTLGARRGLTFLEQQPEVDARKLGVYGHFALSSMLYTAAPKDVTANGASATDKAEPVIDDFTHDWRDWCRLSPDNPHHWEYSTRKLTDPKWQGQPSQRLSLEVQAEKPNELIIVLTENFFRQYRGKQKEFAAVAKLDGGKDTQTVSLEPKDFKASDGMALSSWKNVDLLSIRAYYDKGEKLIGSRSWAGPQPVFRKLSWQGR